MATITLSPELRTKIAQLDEMINGFNELVEDELGSVIEHDETNELYEGLRVVQDLINDVQSEQGWI